MRKYIVPTICLMLSISFYLLYQAKVDSIPSISYFPLDEETGFAEADTNLKMKILNNRGKYIISWNTFSKSEKSLYLRQDISLLFKNGKLLGALSKWHENVKNINLNERVKSKGTGYFQSISYHHGEIHHSEDSIKSIQKMTYDNLYVIEDRLSPVRSFDTLKTKKNKALEQQLNNEIKGTLLNYWDRIFDHYRIKKKNYLIVPLTELNRYNNSPLPTLSQSKTNQIIGQLWEGVYKNYLVPITSASGQVASQIPIVLFGKDNKHLIVLFEINENTERLIQKYP
ncbi:hypothetical protein [Virgibacillus sp. DJP39]|uniref:hypothetical protein n=1 Tax=Virgibacillus sp. DJP39 TaxID=3409790 RepID=UPI003BB54F94